MAKHNYINELTMIGMMNKNCHIIDGKYLAFSKSKSESKVVAFSKNFVPPSSVKQLSLMYLNEEPSKKDFDSVYSLEEIVSKIDASKMFWIGKDRPESALAGKENVERRGTVNKWQKKISEGSLVVEDLDASNLDSVLDMLERWRYLENGGMKYGWQERAGCDKALVRRVVEDFAGIKSRVICKVFKLAGEGVIGYSCIERNPTAEADGIPEIKYLTRKVLNLPGTRNLTEFIDWKTFEGVWLENSCLKEFLVNWGASSGGVHWYKTHKWPLYSLETKWFASKKMVTK